MFFPSFFLLRCMYALVSLAWPLCLTLQPHAQAVTHIALSRDAKLLATVGEDRAIFFLTVHGTALEPIGFVETPGKTNAIDWSSDCTRVLAACQDGAVYEFDVPQVRDYGVCVCVCVCMCVCVCLSLSFFMQLDRRVSSERLSAFPDSARWASTTRLPPSIWRTLPHGAFSLTTRGRSRPRPSRRRYVCLCLYVCMCVCVCV